MCYDDPFYRLFSCLLIVRITQLQCTAKTQHQAMKSSEGEGVKPEEKMGFIHKNGEGLGFSQRSPILISVPSYSRASAVIPSVLITSCPFLLWHPLTLNMTQR